VRGAGLHPCARKCLGLETRRVLKRWRALAEIDENLIRRDLTATQRAKLIARRKAAYEATHPETKQGAVGRGGKKGAKFAAFSEDTAKRTGKSQRSIELDATRAKRLGPDLDRVEGTSLDKGSELDALAAMPAPERQASIVGSRLRYC
jgi:uncharacterized protein (DUF3084 family)